MGPAPNAEPLYLGFGVAIQKKFALEAMVCHGQLHGELVLKLANRNRYKARVLHHLLSCFLDTPLTITMVTYYHGRLN
jgi:hypothetical protein